VLSEHLCQGWLEGYLLTGRHGLFNCYEAFIHIIDSMFNQHAKWLKTTRAIPWRAPIASLNYRRFQAVSASHEMILCDERRLECAVRY
jgi:xylulose-5-phosphate/fructose-6-phosphate phosphoketolase